MIRNPITGEVIPKHWSLTTVNNIKSEEKYACVAGPFGSDISSKYFVDEGVPVIRGNNLTLSNDKFRTEGFVFVSPEQAKRYKGQHVKFNDLVFTCWGTVGQVGIIPENGPFNEYIISNKQLKLRVNENKVNPTYLYYYFSTKSFVKYINNIAIGAAVPGINLGLLKKLPIVLPPKNEQDQIAKHLDYFFDLIENNNQRIQLLEDMAEEIYKEWFVRLRFRGYQDHKFFDKNGEEVPHGTVGALPEGWKEVKVKDFGKVVTGKTPSKADDSNFSGEIPFIKTPDMQRGMFFINTDESLSKRGADSQSNQYVSKNSLSVSCIGTVGKVGITTKLSQTNQQINTLIPKEKNLLEYLYYTIVKLKPVIESYAATGATMANLSKSKFQNLKILNPDSNLISRFHQLSGPMFEEIKILLQKNQVLQETRDLLLPRLISGKLSVTDIDLENNTITAMAAEPKEVYKS